MLFSIWSRVEIDDRKCCLENATEFGQREKNTLNNEKKLAFRYPNFFLLLIIEIIALM